MAETTRIPPNHYEAEQAILGSMLISEKCVYEAVEAVSEYDFYQQQHRDIFRVMTDLVAAGVAVDLVTVSQKMEQTGKLRMGGIEYLTQLSAVVPSVSNLRHYIDIIKQKSSLRSLIDVCVDVLDDCYTAEGDARDIANKAASAVLNIALKDNKSSVVHLREALKESYLRISEAMNSDGGILGLPMGFPTLDDKLSGLQGGQLVVIAARPGMGKTSFAMNIIQHIGLVKKATCLVFSLEMPADQLAGRMLCTEAKVDSQNTRSGRVSGAEITKLAEAIKVLSGTEIYIDDSSTNTVTSMLAKAQSLKRRNGLDLIAIDYLQLMSGSGRIESRQQEISQITRTLKIMAKELNVPILLLSQLSRANEKGENKKPRLPRLSDLRESGAIEQDADVVLFLNREDYYPEDRTEENRGKAKLIIAKQRSGPTGILNMRWDGNLTQYTELDFRHDDDEGDAEY